MKLYHASPADTQQEGPDGADDGEVEVKEYLLWDRKTEGGFPGMCSCVAFAFLDHGALRGEAK